VGDLDSTYAQRAMEIDAIKAQLESTAATGRKAQAVAVAEYQLAQAQRQHPSPAPHAHLTCPPRTPCTLRACSAIPAPPRRLRTTRCTPRTPAPSTSCAPPVPAPPPGPLNTTHGTHDTRRAAFAQASAKRERERADQVMTLQDNIEEIQNHLASGPACSTRHARACQPPCGHGCPCGTHTAPEALVLAQG
jgi:hypothetical protein